MTMTRPLDVLAVDDDLLVLAVVEQMVRHGGHVIRTANSGISALDELRDHAADLVICDIRMPQMDGVELARRIRQSYPQTRIILMTGYLAEHSMGTAQEIGIESILRKPFKSAELLAAIDATSPGPK